MTGTASQTTLGKMPAKSLSAAAQVLTTVELLEQILLRLDMKTLLLSQRVSLGWNAAISQSSMLNKKLFFKPAARKDLLELRMLEEELHPNTLFNLEENLDSNISQVDMGKIWNVWCMGEEIRDIRGRFITFGDCETIVYNPLLLRQQFVAHNPFRLLQLREIPRFMPLDRPKTMLESSTPMPEQRGSWDRMLLVQPSSMKVKTQLSGDQYEQGFEFNWRYYIRLDFDSRMDLGQYLVEAERWARNQDLESGDQDFESTIPRTRTLAFDFIRVGLGNTTRLTILGQPADGTTVLGLSGEV